MKKLTIAEKRIRGTLDQSKIKKPMTFEPLDEIPAPMTRLGAVEMRYYNLVAEILVNSKTLTMAEVPGMTRAAEFYGIFQKAKKEIVK
jgi:hypothetical protein